MVWQVGVGWNRIFYSYYPNISTRLVDQGRHGELLHVRILHEGDEMGAKDLSKSGIVLEENW